MDYISRLFSELWSLYITPGLTGSLTESPPLSEGARSMDTYQVWVPWHFMAWYLKALFLAPGADPFNPLYTMQPHWPGVWLHPNHQHRPHKITSQAPAHFSGTFCFLFLGKVNKRFSKISRFDSLFQPNFWTLWDHFSRKKLWILWVDSYFHILSSYMEQIPSSTFWRSTKPW